MVERAKGIEPSYAAWEAAVLPLNYARERTPENRGTSWHQQAILLHGGPFVESSPVKSTLCFCGSAFRGGLAVSLDHAGGRCRSHKISRHRLRCRADPAPGNDIVPEVNLDFLRDARSRDCVRQEASDERNIADRRCAAVRSLIDVQPEFLTGRGHASRGGYPKRALDRRLVGNTWLDLRSRRDIELFPDLVGRAAGAQDQAAE